MKKPIFALVLIMLIPTIASANLNEATAAHENRDDELFPPNAQPGECYTRVFVPPVYVTKSETVLKRQASDRLEIIPARFEEVTERVLIKEATVKLEIVPATYGWAEEQIMTKPETKKLVTVAAEYEMVSEQVLDTPAHTVWKKGEGLIQKVDGTTGEIMCLVEIPATYKTVTKRVLTSPASVREVPIPAEYRTVKRKVVQTAASTREVHIPAEYQTVTVTKMVSPPRTNKIAIPAEHQTVTHQSMVEEGRMEWRTVLCNTNVTRNRIQNLQRSLRQQGFDPGQIDGVVGSETLSALAAYQRSKGLPAGALTLETLKSLGI